MFLFLFCVHRQRWGQPDHPYDWRRHQWLCRWLMRPICARKSLGQWEQGMVVTVPFLSFLRSSVAAFLLVSQTFVPRLTSSHNLFLSYARYSWQLARYQKNSWKYSACLRSAFFSGLLGSACPEIVHRRAVSSGGGDLSCEQQGQPNEAVIASRWCRCCEEKLELKLLCRGCIFAIWYRESSSDSSCETGLASFYTADKLSTRFTAIKEDGKNDNSVYLDFGRLRDTSRIPHIPVQSAKVCTRFFEPGVHLLIHDDRIRKACCRGRLTFLPPSVVVPWWWFWAQCIVFHALAGALLLGFFCFVLFFVLMVGLKFSQDIENLSIVFCMLALVVAFSAQLSANRNLLMISVFTLIFARRLLRLKTEPSVR